MFVCMTNASNRKVMGSIQSHHAMFNCLSYRAVVRPPPTSTPPLIWLTSVSVASQNIADASLRHTQHFCHCSLRIALSRRSYSIRSGKLRSMVLSQTDLKNTKWQETHAVRNRQSARQTSPKVESRNLGDFHSCHCWRCTVGTAWHSPFTWLSSGL